MISNHKDNLIALLKENYIHDTFMTHVSLIQPKGKYSLSRSVLGTFWTLYCKLIESGDDTLGIAESPPTYSALRVDVDLKFRIENYIPSTALYPKEFVEKLVVIYQSILKELVVDITERQLYCVLLEKSVKATEVENQYKNGFHLHFPFLFLSKTDQEVQIYPRVKKALLENSFNIHETFQTFKDDLWDNETSIESLIDIASLKNCWLLYGSRKSTNLDTYCISKIYTHSLQELSIFEVFLDADIYDEDENRIELNERNLVFHLPRIFSIIPYGRKTSELKRNTEIRDPSLFKYIEKKPYQTMEEDKRSEKDIKSDILQLKMLIGLLKSERANDHNNWMTIGWAIYHITKGSDDGLDLWIKFSTKSEKLSRSESRCIYEWSNMTDKYRVTMGTIKYFAKQDNPEGYAKFVFDINQKNMRKGKELKTSHFDLAILLHSQFGNEYVYTNVGWFRFLNHHWECIDEGLELRSRISKELVDFFTLMLRELCVEELSNFTVVNNDDDEEEKEEDDSIEKRKKVIRMLIQNLKTTPFKNNIMKECQEVFHIRDFHRKLNSNRYLIGFQNGVYDLENNIFREGLPSDFISTQMAISYVEFSETDSRVKDVIDFLDKVFPDREVRRYFLDVMSETFVGYNHRKQVYFWTGEGDNGKSITQMFFEKMFGKLSIKAPTTLITSRRQQSGSANAELARAGNGVRTIFLEEPDPDEEIYTGVFKHLSGNDSIYSRDLFQKGKDVNEIIPMFKLYVICNKLPRIRKGGDRATWNRIRVIPFAATFTKDPPATVEEQNASFKFPVDPNFAQKIPSLVEPFCWILMRQRMRPKGTEPKSVLEATEKYKSDNDLICRFTKYAGIIEDEGAEAPVDNLYNYYIEWMESEYPTKEIRPTILNRTEFEEHFTKKWNKQPVNRIWKGIRSTLSGGSIANNNINNII